MAEENVKEFLLNKLKRWDNFYFNEGTPEVADTEYDRVKSALRDQYPNDVYFTGVGTPITKKYEEIKLPFIVGGLDKVDVDTVLQWINKENDAIIVTEKLDGNSIICTWDNGKLIFAASRGDGITGQNIINKAKYFIPEIPIKDWVTLRGEVLLEGDLYKGLGFKNRRNGVAGLLRRDEIIPEDLQKLSCIFYEVIEPEIESEAHRLAFIKLTLKLRIPENRIILPGTAKISETLSELLINYKENALYDIDGLVLTRNNSSRENVKFPKAKVKFKVNELAKECEVRGLEWNVTRLGMIKPVVIINPTEIMGVTVTRISGFNKEFIESNQIHTGAIVGVVRSGDVIPYITEVFQPSPFVPIPENCPSCDSVLVETEKEIICVNDECYQKKIYKVSYFFTEMGTDNISDRTIEMLGIFSIEDAYNLQVEDIEKIPGFGRRKAEIVYGEIRDTLVTKPERLLAAFGMPLIGTTISKSLMSKFTIDVLFEITNPDVLGLGPVTSRSLIDNIGKYRDLYNFLIDEGLEFEKEDLTLKTLKGMKFALTGAGPLKRKEYISMCEEKGGEVKGISKDTNYLVTNDVTTNSEKIKAANKYGTKIITYEEFGEMLK